MKKHGFSASILDDCSYNFIAQPEDKMTTDELMCRVGTYDRWAIEWGYRIFPNSKDVESDKKLLKNLADKRLENKTLLYMKNTSCDLRALPSDLSSDKIEAARLGIRNMERFIKNLDKLSATEDLKANSWQTYMTGGQNALGMLYQNLVYKVMENLGSRMQLERDEVFASKGLQKQTMEFLAENVFAEPQKWMYDEVLAKEFGVGPKTIRFNLQEIVFSYLLNPKVIENMERATRMEGDKAYSLIDYWGDIRRLIFKDFSKDVVKVIDDYNITKNNSILEVGCGEGRDTIHLLNMGYHNILGIDYSKIVIAKCNELTNNKYVNNFKSLDIMKDKLNNKYDFIYSVAVIHMFLKEEHRNLFYKFIYEHLNNNGIALVISMGDGTSTYKSNIDDAFKKVVRKNINTNKEIMVTNTSCNIVDFATFKEEIIRNNFKIIECYISSDIPNFDKCMCAVISKQE